MKRTEAINIVINILLEVSDLRDILFDGFKGINNMSTKELIKLAKDLTED